MGNKKFPKAMTSQDMIVAIERSVSRKQKKEQFDCNLGSKIQRKKICVFSFF